MVTAATSPFPMSGGSAGEKACATGAPEVMLNGETAAAAFCGVGGARPPTAFRGGPDHGTAEPACEISDAACQSEQETDSNCRFNAPGRGNEAVGVHRDQTQPHMKPPLQPMRLSVRGVLKVTD